MIRVLREAKEAPADIQERIARAGGSNRFGEPNFRVVWGWSRLSWIGGRWIDRDQNGNICPRTNRIAPRAEIHSI